MGKIFSSLSVYLDGLFYVISLFLIISFLEGCSVVTTTNSSVTANYSCFLQAPTSSSCTLPTVCATYTGSNWTSSLAQTDCNQPSSTSGSSTTAEQVAFNAMPGCSSVTPSLTYNTNGSCSAQLAAGATTVGTTYTEVASCSVNSGNANAIVYFYYSSPSLPAQSLESQADCTNKGGTYTLFASVNTNYIYLFVTSSTSAGNAITRSSADTSCRNTLSSLYSNLSCTNVRAVMSFNTSDQISNMSTNYSIPTLSAVVDGPTGTSVIATSWSQMIAGSLNMSLNSAGVTSSSFWTGSTDGGLVDPTDDCSNWTSTAQNNQTISGAAGNPLVTNNLWMRSDSDLACNTSQNLLCVCF